MNIELDEVVLQDITDEALERAAGGAQGGGGTIGEVVATYCCMGVLAIADR